MASVELIAGRVFGHRQGVERFQLGLQGVATGLRVGAFGEVALGAVEVFFGSAQLFCGVILGPCLARNRDGLTGVAHLLDWRSAAAGSAESEDDQGKRAPQSARQPAGRNGIREGEHGRKLARAWPTVKQATGRSARPGSVRRKTSGPSRLALSGSCLDTFRTVKLTIYHNPRCSKSRQTLAILRDHGIEPRIVHYLEDMPDAATLTRLARILGVGVADMMREGEQEYRDARDLPENDEAALAEWLSRHPKVLQRPVVVDEANGRAVIGRPPENVLDLIGRGDG